MLFKKGGTDDNDLESDDFDDDEDFDDDFEEDFDHEEAKNETRKAGNMTEDHKSRFENSKMPSSEGKCGFSSNSKRACCLSIVLLKGGERRKLKMKSKKSLHTNTDSSSRNKTKLILIRRVSLFYHLLIHSKTF